MTLREGLIAMADSAEGCASSISRGIAIAAARMALEDAQQTCIGERVDAEATGAPEDAAYNTATSHCADAIRALRDGLDK